MCERLVSRAGELAKFIERFEGAMDAAAGEVVDVAALIGSLASERPRVHADVPRGLPQAWASTMLARRVLEELLDNACKFSPTDTPVTLEIGSTPEYVTVRVRDRGPGIPVEYRDRIFEPLEQVEQLDVRMHQGAGVGLSLARTAARAMDGDLVLEATGPDGSTFLWTLPVESSSRAT
jgi:two-component system sensor histidine kinase KdpD